MRDSRFTVLNPFLVVSRFLCFRFRQVISLVLSEKVNLTWTQSTTFNICVEKNDKLTNDKTAAKRMF